MGNYYRNKEEHQERMWE